MTLSLARRSLTLILSEVQPPHCRDKPIGPFIYVIIFCPFFLFIGDVHRVPLASIRMYCIHLSVLMPNEVGSIVHIPCACTCAVFEEHPNNFHLSYSRRPVPIPSPDIHIRAVLKEYSSDPHVRLAMPDARRSRHRGSSERSHPMRNR